MVVTICFLRRVVADAACTTPAAVAGHVVAARMSLRPEESIDGGDRERRHQRSTTGEQFYEEGVTCWEEPA
jgi:hypothetical protein